MLAERLNVATRDPDDRARDADRKPNEVLDYLGLKTGMVALDVMAAGGYYTEVLSLAVGPEGRVLAQNPLRMLQFRDGANDKALTARLKERRLPNVVRLDGELGEVEIAENSVDVAITALNFHDVYNRSREQSIEMLKTIHSKLKPGGVLGIVDHAGTADGDNAKLHRMQETAAIAAAEVAGFTLVGGSNILRNAQDDRSGFVFGADIRGKTDRFILKLRK